MPIVPAVRRVSPRVRTLAAEHTVAVRRVAGTGRGGRVTPNDVLRVAGRPRRPTGGLLASPAARRVLRGAGVDARDHVGPDDPPLTRASAERLASRQGDAEGGPEAAAAPGASSGEGVVVDVGRLLSRLAGTDGGELPLAPVVAVAAARAVGARADAASDGASPVDVGLVVDGAVGTVADATSFSAAGLARRARAATDGGAAATGAPALVVADEDALAAARGAGVPVLLVGAPYLVEVEGEDELGLRVVRSVPAARLRLVAPDDERPENGLLAAVVDVLAGPDLPIGP